MNFQMVIQMRQNNVPQEPLLFRMLDACVKWVLVICLILYVLSPIFR